MEVRRPDLLCFVWVGIEVIRNSLFDRSGQMARDGREHLKRLRERDEAGVSRVLTRLYSNTRTASLESSLLRGGGAFT